MSAPENQLIAPSSWAPEQPTLEELQLVELAEEIGALVELKTSWGGEITQDVEAVVLREARCTVRIWEGGLYGGAFKGERTENGVRWGFTAADTPEEVLKNLGPEPSAWTAESYVIQACENAYANHAARPQGPPPKCKCGRARMEWFDNHGTWERKFGLRCPICGEEIASGDNRGMRAFKKAQTPKPVSGEKQDRNWMAYPGDGTPMPWE